MTHAAGTKMAGYSMMVLFIDNGPVLKPSTQVGWPAYVGAGIEFFQAYAKRSLGAREGLHEKPI